MQSAGLTGIALSALAGVMVGLLVQLWKSIRDERRILCDEFCKVALEAADAASAYWKGGGNATETEASRLMAFQKRLDGYRVLLAPAFTPEGSKEVLSACGDLFDVLTGGEFRSKQKPADERRASASHMAAADLVIAVRRAFIRSVSLGAVLQHLFIRNPVNLFQNTRTVIWPKKAVNRTNNP